MGENEASTREAGLAKRGSVFRAKGIPASWTYAQFQNNLAHAVDLDAIQISVLSFASYPVDGTITRVALFNFATPPSNVCETKSAAVQGQQGNYSKNRTWRVTRVLGDENSSDALTLFTFDSHFLGFTPISPVQNDSDYDVDCFVIHGWGGHAYGSFKMPSPSPSSWLLSLNGPLPKLRIWLYGYDADVQNDRTIQDYAMWGETFRIELRELRRETGLDIPMIFMAHSLGGWIFKQAIIGMHKSTDTDDKQNHRATYGALFFGVPTQGMEAEHIIQWLEGKPQQFQGHLLDRNVGYISRSELHQRFCAAFNDEDTIIVQFFETLKSPTMQKDPESGEFKENGPAKLLVSPDSAVHGRHWETEMGKHIYDLAGDHKTMIKFDPESRNFVAMKGVLRKMCEEAPEIISRKRSEDFTSDSGVPYLRGPGKKASKPSNELLQLRKQSILKIPFLQNDNFFGRTQELNEIHQHLRGAQLGNKLYKATISGLPGLGKSQLAIEYCYRCRDSYNAIFWLRAEDDSVLEHDYASIWDSFDSSNAVERINDRTNKVFNLFESAAFAWLIVFDNVDQNTNLKKYIPGPGTGSVLITTRNSNIADSISARHIKLTKFNTKEATEFFLKRSGRMNDPKKAVQDFVTELDGFPLALSQMAGYVRRNQCSIEKLFERYQKRKSQIFNHNDLRESSYDLTVQQCINLSLDNLTPEESSLIDLLAFFNTDEIEESLIEVDQDEDADLSNVDLQMDREKAIDGIHTRSLITRTEFENGTNLWMHRVVKLSIMHNLDKNKHLKTTTFQKATATISTRFPRRPIQGETMGDKYAACERWLPHVLSLFQIETESGSSTKPDLKYAELLANCGWYLWERGNENLARRLLKASQHLCNSILDYENDPSPIQADNWTLLGSMKLFSCSPKLREEGLELQREALVSRQKYDGLCQSDENQDKEDKKAARIQLANAHNNVGCAQMACGRFDKAEPDIQDGLNIKKECGTEENLKYEFAISLYNLARVWIGQNQLEAAYESVKHSWELAKEHYGENNYRVNVFRFTYAEMLFARDEVESAYKMHEEILEQRRKEPGQMTNDTAASCYAIGRIHHHRRKFNEAAEMIQQAINIYDSEEVPEADDRTARSYYRLSLIERDRGKTEKAEELREKARQYKRRVTDAPLRIEDETMEEYDKLVVYYNK